MEILVSLHLNGMTYSVGRLWSHSGRNAESASFEYEETWLKNPLHFALEPALQLTAGSFHTPQGTRLFGSIGDSAPDRWGRILMRRASFSQQAERQSPPRTLRETDYLLGVCDEARQGALRFSVPENKERFLSPYSTNAIPPLIKLPKLLSATEHLLDDDANAADFRLLLAPGSSLGGARPKASILDNDGSLAIAKFPRKDDEYNTVLWEALALTLAQKAKIHVPTWRLASILNKPVLIIKRFDRHHTNRIPFLSAMSMLGAQDNEPHSYLEIAYAIMQHSGQPSVDLAELWRRIIFNIMIANTDDHLRNHAFLYSTQQHWRLSPVYDVNPTPLHIKPRVLTTSINFDEAEGSLDLAYSIAQEFRLSSEQCRIITQEVTHAVATWRETAQTLGLSKAECDFMASAFEYPP